VVKEGPKLGIGRVLPTLAKRVDNSKAKNCGEEPIIINGDNK